MDRDGALALIKSLGFDSLMVAAKRTTEDEVVGYAPALDRAFATYTVMKESTTALVVVAAEDEYGFGSLLKAVTYDLILPTVAATMVDVSIDAPLTSAKYSQQYKALKELRDQAWIEAGYYGYVSATNMDGMRTNLDFLEPNDDCGAEYG